MEEDIKILEEFIEDYSLNEELADDHFIEALKNLIKGYRELEKENEKLIYELQEKEHEIKCANRDIKVFETDFIPKSKIKEKIRQIEMNQKNIILFARGNGKSDKVLQQIIDNQVKKVLQELMEDK